MNPDFAFHERLRVENVRAALGVQRARVGLTSTLVFCDGNGGPLSLKEVRGSGCFGMPGFASAPYQCPHTYATLLLSEGLNPLYQPIGWGIRR
jgi:hypothetical protein